MTTLTPEALRHHARLIRARRNSLRAESDASLALTELFVCYENEADRLDAEAKQGATIEAPARSEPKVATGSDTSVAGAVDISGLCEQLIVIADDWEPDGVLQAEGMCSPTAAMLRDAAAALETLNKRCRRYETTLRNYAMDALIGHKARRVLSGKGGGT